MIHMSSVLWGFLNIALSRNMPEEVALHNLILIAISILMDIIIILKYTILNP